MGHVEGLEDWGLEAFNFTKKRFFCLLVFVFGGFCLWWFLSLVGFVFGGFCLWWVLGFVLG